MKKRSLFFLIIATLASSVMTGCGTPLYEMTADEEELIVQAAAGTVAKYNIRMTDGSNWVTLPEETETEEPEGTETETTTEETEDPNNQNPGDKTDDKTDKTSKYVEATLEEAIGYSDKLSFTYVGMELKDDVVKNNMLITASSGTKLIVVTFEMKNISDQAIELNMVDADIDYAICLKDEKFSSMKANFFSLDTYLGTIEKGASEKVTLIFEEKESNTEGIVNAFLKVKRNGTSYSVKL